MNVIICQQSGSNRWRFFSEKRIFVHIKYVDVIHNYLEIIRNKIFNSLHGTKSDNNRIEYRLYITFNNLQLLWWKRIARKYEFTWIYTAR